MDVFGGINNNANEARISADVREQTPTGKEINKFHKGLNNK